MAVLKLFKLLVAFFLLVTLVAGTPDSNAGGCADICEGGFEKCIKTTIRPVWWYFCHKQPCTNEYKDIESLSWCK